MPRQTAAQRRATSYLTTTSESPATGGDYGNCRICGKPLAAHEFNVCTTCAAFSDDRVLLRENSEDWMEEAQ